MKIVTKAQSKNTILQFVNQKFCNGALEKRKLITVNKTKLGFQPDNTPYVSENLVTFNQHLAWQCREPKRAKLIHSCVGVQRML